MSVASGRAPTLGSWAAHTRQKYPLCVLVSIHRRPCSLALALLTSNIGFQWRIAVVPVQLVVDGARGALDGALCRRRGKRMSSLLRLRLRLLRLRLLLRHGRLPYQPASDRCWGIDKHAGRGPLGRRRDPEVHVARRLCYVVDGRRRVGLGECEL